MKRPQTFTEHEGVQFAVTGKLPHYSEVVLAQNLSVGAVCAMFYSTASAPVFIFLNIYDSEVSGVGGKSEYAAKLTRAILALCWTEQNQQLSLGISCACRRDAKDGEEKAQCLRQAGRAVSFLGERITERTSDLYNLSFVLLASWKREMFFAFYTPLSSHQEETLSFAF